MTETIDPFLIKEYSGLSGVMGKYVIVFERFVKVENLQ